MARHCLAPQPRRLQLEQLEVRSLLATLPTGFTEAAVATGIASGTTMEFAPNGDLWVLEQAGAVKRFRPGSATADIVGHIGTLGLSSTGERGLLGIAFDPQYESNKQMYLYYTATQGGVHNRISRFTVNDTTPADYFFVGTSEQGTDKGSTGAPTQAVIIDLDPLSATNHNGGAIHFGPDGKLFVAVGENAVPSNAPSLATTHGKILRMNSDGSPPTDNPFFASTTGKQRTIWALGLRNPYRCSSTMSGKAPGKRSTMVCGERITAGRRSKAMAARPSMWTRFTPIRTATARCRAGRSRAELFTIPR
jgi:glucose/arabinose dehydrogenase